MRKTNLNKLVGEVSFATNNIHLLYDKTDWRPTHYVRGEGVVLPDNWQVSVNIHRELGCELWLNHVFGGDMQTCQHNQKHFDSPECPHMLHLPVICGFGTSVNIAVQIAMLKQFSPIYLVGCDLGYVDGAQNHFDPHYEHGQEQSARYANMDAITAHTLAARTGYPIFNATKGGVLDVFERVDYDSLF